MNRFNLYLILVFGIALLSAIFIPQTNYKGMSVVFISEQTQDTALEKISPLRRALWQSPLENYYMFKGLQGDELNG